MNFDNLKYSQKIAIAKIYFRETFYKGNSLDFIPKDVYMNFTFIEFYSKASGVIRVKVSVIKNFFENNNQIIRREKLLEIKSNRYFS